MAFTLNEAAKNNTTGAQANTAISYPSLLGKIYQMSTLSGTGKLYLYPSSVTYANASVLSTGTGSIANLTLSTVNVTMTSNTIAFVGGAVQLNPSANGTVSWFAIAVTNSNGQNIICDSVSALGGGGMLQLSNTTLTVGQTVQTTLALTIT